MFKTIKEAKDYCIEMGANPSKSIFIKRLDNYIGFVEIDNDEYEGEILDGDCFISFMCAFENHIKASNLDAIHEPLRLGNGKYLLKELIKIKPDIKRILGTTSKETMLFWEGVGAKILGKTWTESFNFVLYTNDLKI
ncbi:hypothetical protein C4D27_14240 [Clostridium perfringens]